MTQGSELTQIGRLIELNGVLLTRIILLVSLLLGLQTPLFAEWSFSGYTGFARTSNGPLLFSDRSENTRLTFREVDWEGRSFDRPLYWGGRLGRKLIEIGVFEVGPEVEWVHLKAYLNTDLPGEVDGFLEGEETHRLIRVNQVLEEFNVSHGSNLILANLAIASDFLPGPEWTDHDSRLTSRLGYGINISHFEGRLPGGPRLEQWEFGGDVFQAGVGLEVPLWSSVFGLVEYKYTVTSPRGNLSEEVEIATDLSSHHLVLGLTIDLGT